MKTQIAQIQANGSLSKSFMLERNESGTHSYTHLFGSLAIAALVDSCLMGAVEPWESRIVFCALDITDV